MKVCAHISPGCGAFSMIHKRFDTIWLAVEYFKALTEHDLMTVTEDTVMDLYPQCDDCSSLMNFHDYPMVRYAVGPRGGIRKVIV